MNREEEIIKAAEKTSKAMWDFIDDDYTIPFKHGAQWADSHPLEASDDVVTISKDRYEQLLQYEQEYKQRQAMILSFMQNK